MKDKFKEIGKRSTDTPAATYLQIPDLLRREAKHAARLPRRRPQNAHVGGHGDDDEVSDEGCRFINPPEVSR